MCIRDSDTRAGARGGAAAALADGLGGGAPARAGARLRGRLQLLPPPARELRGACSRGIGRCCSRTNSKS